MLPSMHYVSNDQLFKKYKERVMIVYITVTQDELDEMDLSEDSLHELIYDSELADDLVEFDVQINVK